MSSARHPKAGPWCSLSPSPVPLQELGQTSQAAEHYLLPKLRCDLGGSVHMGLQYLQGEEQATELLGEWGASSPPPHRLAPNLQRA